MENGNKDYYIVSSVGNPAAAVGYLSGLIKGLDRQFDDMSINFTIWEGRDTTGAIVAERIDGEWSFMDD